MAREALPLAQLRVTPHHLWSEQWLLLTCGDFASGNFNTMTVGWGSLGTMWAKPFAQIVVRPGRYTHEFMERFDHFTLSAFSERHRKALMHLGTRSGRDGDKLSQTGLTPVASTEIASPGFAEAELILECRKIYRQIMDPAGFLDPAIDKNYPTNDYHTIYYGEILAAFGETAYRS
jgi:flavin reductase (DIM6/NTAB) family NADH-FMN oxidoreductase RutF